MIMRWCGPVFVPCWKANRTARFAGKPLPAARPIALAQQLKPHLVILDITMPELNGLEAARQIRKLAPATQILILSVHESEELVREIVEIGAHGYILKSDAGRELSAAVHALRHGEALLCVPGRPGRIARLPE